MQWPSWLRPAPPLPRIVTPPRDLTLNDLDGMWAFRETSWLVLKHGSSANLPLVIGRWKELLWIDDTKEFVVCDGKTPGGVFRWKLVENT